MPTGKRNTPSKPNYAIIVGIFFLVSLLLGTTSCLLWAATQQQILSKNATATSEEGVRLNTTYGEEVGSTIENFDAKWLSLLSHQRPATQSELATGVYLEYMGLAREDQAVSSQHWIVTKSADEIYVRVLEYGTDKFKAVAQVLTYQDELSSKGEFVKSLPTYKSCGIYVFARKDEKWKLAAFFNMTDPRRVSRDWSDAPEWLKQIVGELPDIAVNDCDELSRK